MAPWIGFSVCPVERQEAHTERPCLASCRAAFSFSGRDRGRAGVLANQLAAGPCNEPTGRALPRAKALQHVLSDAGVTKSDEERCIVGADIRLTALVAGRGRFLSHAPNEIHEGVVAHGFSFSGLRLGLTGRRR